MWGSGNCYNHIGRTSTDDELVNYLNHPGNALKLIQSLEKFGYPDGIPPPPTAFPMISGSKHRFCSQCGAEATGEDV